jgi:hypothetical protein
MRAHTTSLIVAAELPNGQTELTVVIQTDCPHCGDCRWILPGHHLKTLRDVLIEAIDLYPELSGLEPVKAKTERIVIQGGGDPTTN